MYVILPWMVIEEENQKSKLKLKFQWMNIEEEISKPSIKIHVSKVQGVKRISILPWMIIEEEIPGHILMDSVDEFHLEILTVLINPRVFDAKVANGIHF